MPDSLVIGGDQPFLRRRIGVSMSPVVGSIYNMGVWDKVVVAWVKAGVRRTLEGEAVARLRHQETGLSFEISILHCCMAMGRRQVSFIEARLGDLAKDNTMAVQRVVYRAHTGVKLGSLDAPDAEEAEVLVLAWDESGPLLAYAPKDGEWLPCGTSSGTCVRIPHLMPTYAPPRSRGPTACIVARPPTNRTTSSTWSRT